MRPCPADALGCDAAAAADRLQHLCAVLPPLRPRLGAVGVPALASMCRDLPGLSRRLLDLRQMFPTCDVGAMVCTSPFLLTEDTEAIHDSLAALRRLFPNAGRDGKPGVERMVQAVPQLLDAAFAAAAVQAVAGSFGKTPAEAAEMVHGRGGS